MPLYVDEVEARVTPAANAAEPTGPGLSPDQFRSLVNAVVHAIDERRRSERDFQADATITVRNRPPSIGD